MPRALRSNKIPFDVGLDIVEIGRVRALAKRSPGFLKRVFSAEEIAYCSGKKNQWQHFAVRFAAKEAVWKALEASKLALKDISVDRDALGRPGVRIKGRLRPELKISLSHSERYALAVAIRLS